MMLSLYVCSNKSLCEKDGANIIIPTLEMNKLRPTSETRHDCQCQMHLLISQVGTWLWCCWCPTNALNNVVLSGSTQIDTDEPQWMGSDAE